MRKIFLLTIGAMAMLGVRAQVVVTVQLPPLGLTVKPQLWNLSLINTSNEALNVRVDMVMTDIATNQAVLTGTSRTLHLPRGAKHIQPADVMPVTYQAGNAGYPVDPGPDGFLPIGTFNVCYQVIKLNSDAPEQISEECVTMQVEPISPPQLILPLDEEQVHITRPFFAWMPPAPVNSYSSLLYDWLLVEVMPTQSAADAIQQNIPIYTQQNISFTSLQYPLSMPELDTAKWYAWRITAKQQTSPIANSEIWTFRVKQYETDTTPGIPAGYFGRLRRDENGAFMVCTGVLRFEYQHENNAPAADIRIFDISSNQRRLVTLDAAAQQVKYGQNFIQIDLRENADMIDRHMYLLELRNGKNERWYLKFEFRQMPGQ